MASRNKHRERSHKTYNKNVMAGNFAAFERKARAQKIRTENRSLFQTLKDMAASVKDKVFKHQDR